MRQNFKIVKHKIFKYIYAVKNVRKLEILYAFLSNFISIYASNFDDVTLYYDLLESTRTRTADVKIHIQTKGKIRSSVSQRTITLFCTYTEYNFVLSFTNLCTDVQMRTETYRNVQITVQIRINMYNYVWRRTHAYKYVHIRSNTHKFVQIRTNTYKYVHIRTNMYKYVKTFKYVQ